MFWEYVEHVNSILNVVISAVSILVFIASKMW